MTAIEVPRLTQRESYRLVDESASTEAAAALHVSAGRTGDAVLAAAAALLRDSDDPAALDALRVAITAPDFSQRVIQWTRELREAASVAPESGACTVATALKLWHWTFRHVRAEYASELAELLTPLLAARALALDVVARADRDLRQDLSHVYSARSSACVGASCAELVYGDRRHLVWDAEGCATCYTSDDLEELEGFMPGFASGGRTTSDVIEADGSHPAKRGPCADAKGLDVFVRLRNRLDVCLTGSRIAKNRAAAAIGRV